MFAKRDLFVAGDDSVRERMCDIDVFWPESSIRSGKVICNVVSKERGGFV